MPDGVALDLEVTDSRSPAEVDEWAVSVVGALALKLARVPLLYTYLSFAEEKRTRLGRYPAVDQRSLERGREPAGAQAIGHLDAAPVLDHRLD